MNIIFIPANKQAREFFTPNWKKELIAAQPILSHFEDRIFLLDTVSPGKGLATLQHTILPEKAELTPSGVILRYHPVYGDFGWKSFLGFLAQGALSLHTGLLSFVSGMWTSTASLVTALVSTSHSDNTISASTATPTPTSTSTSTSTSTPISTSRSNLNLVSNPSITTKSTCRSPVISTPSLTSEHIMYK